MKVFAVTIFLLYLHSANAATPKPFVKCTRKWEKIGCFHDSLSPRPLPELLLNDRDKFSVKNDGHALDWYNYEESLHSLACRCAEKARAKGYKIFGMQFYGECWSGPNAEMVFSNDGPSNNCIQSVYDPKECVKADPFSECIGGPKTNFIYRLTDNTPAPQSPDINGGYSKWSDWSQCSASCGKGQTSRERICNNPTPKGNGKPCYPHLGLPHQISECHLMDCPSPCHKTMDVGFVIDSSSSVRRENFGKVKKFLIELINELDVSPIKTHVGVIQYNHRSYLLWDLNKQELYNKQQLEEAVENIQFKPGATRTDLALEMAGSKLLAGPGSRPNVPKILLVLTDGKTSSNSKPYNLVLKNLKGNVPNIKIVSVGVGPFIDAKELEDIAGGDKKEVFKLASFSELVQRLQDILVAFCQTRL